MTQIGSHKRLLRISTHTSRVGCDNKITVSYVLLFAFLLTHPVWDVTTSNSSATSSPTFLLTHPVWDVTITNQSGFNWLDISTHTSRVGCDARRLWNCITIKPFLLTHPVWDVTKRGSGRNMPTQNFYSHIPCGM